MSNPIVINPAEVVALSESRKTSGTDNLWKAQYMNQPLVERLGASGNQARLNNGCVCDSGCDSCARLTEAFTSIQEAAGLLETAARRYANGSDTSATYVLRLCESMHAALALAAKA